MLKARLPSPALLIAFSFSSGFYLDTPPSNLVGIFEIKKNHNIFRKEQKSQQKHSPFRGATSNAFISKDEGYAPLGSFLKRVFMTVACSFTLSHSLSIRPEATNLSTS